MTTLLAFALALPVSAAQFHWKLSVDSIESKSIGDEAKEVRVDDWVCTVGEPKGDGYGNEVRRLGCGMPEGLQAYLLTGCYKDKKTGKVKSENGVLNLQMKKSGSKMIALSCQ